MSESKGGNGTFGANMHRGNAGKRPMATTQEGATPPLTTPCGACKFLRRKCAGGCIFAPYFGSDQGAAKFAAVHKVFGASNVSKLLLHIPANRRHEAVTTICYEAQARLSDPIYGCVSTIIALQQQVATLQAEVNMTQTQLVNGRIAYASALENTHQHLQQTNINLGQNPAYSNNSSASTNLLNMNNFNLGFDLTMETTPPSSSLSLQPLHNLTRLSQYDEEDEHESKIPPGFNHDM